MTIPTGQGRKCGLEAADEPGTALPSRPQRAMANAEAAAGWHIDSKPPDKSDDAVVDMKRSGVY